MLRHSSSTWRTDLDPLEEAAGYRALRDLGMTQQAIAKTMHRSQPAIANTIRSLKLPKTVQNPGAGGQAPQGAMRRPRNARDSRAARTMSAEWSSERRDRSTPTSLSGRRTPIRRRLGSVGDPWRVLPRAPQRSV